MTKHKYSSLPLLPLPGCGNYNVYTTMRGVTQSQADDPYAGFNVCHYTGDTPAHVAECRSNLAQAFGTDVAHLIIPRQTHSTSVLSITDTLPTPEELKGVDGIVTTRRDIIIGVSTADCVPLIMIDPVGGVTAAVHAGWRGALGGIATEALRAMKQLGAQPARITAVMGPSICRDCFEVGEEVAGLFPPTCVRTVGYDKPHVSLQTYIT
ncbi:MAG: polyphenol oxidase family protein, partial [Duncaniella sp.]|nr:polyphenol oxidase family protein [Duncaniella sp.]